MAQTKITSSTTAATVLGADQARVTGALVFANSDANPCYVLLDSGTPSSSNYSFVVPTGGAPIGPIYGYTGAVQAVWGTAGSGALMITEWVN